MDMKKLTFVIGSIYNPEKLYYDALESCSMFPNLLAQNILIAYQLTKLLSDCEELSIEELEAKKNELILEIVENIGKDLVDHNLHKLSMIGLVDVDFETGEAKINSAGNDLLSKMFGSDPNFEIEGDRDEFDN